MVLYAGTLVLDVGNGSRLKHSTATTATTNTVCRAAAAAATEVDVRSRDIVKQLFVL